MRHQASPQSLASFWNPHFPGQISDHLVIAEELTENVIDLEGHNLVVVPLGHTDTDNTTCLHVPSIGLVVVIDRWGPTGLLYRWHRLGMVAGDERSTI